MVTHEKTIVKAITNNKYACFNCVNLNIDCEKKNYRSNQNLLSVWEDP